MNKHQIIGWFILLLSIIGIATYFYLTFLSQWTILTIQLTALLAIGAVLVIVAWIGYTIATTPPPTPIENLERETETKDRKEDAIQTQQ